MKKIFYTLAVCWCLFWTWGILTAQIPRGRLPMPRNEVNDLLVQKADTSVTNNLQAQIDAAVIGTEDSLNPLINRMVLDNVLIVEAGAGATIRVLGPTGGDFTVIIHDSLTAVAHDSALAVTDDDITFVWIDEDGVLQTATVGFPAELGGGEDSTVVQIATVGTASGFIVWISTHYDHKKDRLIDLHEFIEEIHSYSVHSGFEIAIGTSSNLGFDFGSGSTTNDMHSIHGWRATHADDADLTFIDDIFAGGSGTTFDNTVYGNNQSMTNNYYSKFRLWLVANNAGINEFHITRSTSEWADVAHAEAAGWPAVPAGYADSKIDLVGVVYKKGKTWDNLDSVKDWIVTDFTATGISSAGGAVGLGPEDIGAIVGDTANVLRAEAWNPADSTLSLKLPEYFTWNVVDIELYTGTYSGWALINGEGADAVTIDNTDYLTDASAIKIKADAADEGGYVDWAGTRDFTVFSDGDASTTADYINLGVHFASGEYTKLHTDGIQIVFCGDAYATETNSYYFNITKANLTDDGWAYPKIAKSAFSSNGSPNWNSIDWIQVIFAGSPSSSCVFTIDNIQLVRDDPDAAEPNPFQSETTQDTWTADWTQEGNGNLWLVEESSQLRIIAASSSDRIVTSKSYGDFDASGVVHIDGSSTAYVFNYDAVAPLARNVVISSGNLLVDDSTGANHTASFSVSSGDRIYWRAIRKGTSITGMASHDGINWTTVSTFCYTGLKQLAWPGTGGTPRSKQSSIAFSTVAYAAEAGVAQRLKDWHFDYTGGLFKIFMPDSVLWFTPDSVTVNPN